MTTIAEDHEDRIAALEREVSTLLAAVKLLMARLGPPSADERARMTQAGRDLLASAEETLRPRD